MLVCVFVYCFERTYIYICVCTYIHICTHTMHRVGRNMIKIYYIKNYFLKIKLLRWKSISSEKPSTEPASPPGGGRKARVATSNG